MTGASRFLTGLAICRATHDGIPAVARASWRRQVMGGAAICRACTVIERALPDNPGARVADEAAVRAGDYNYPAVGAPPDLIGA